MVDFMHLKPQHGLDVGGTYMTPEECQHLNFCEGESNIDLSQDYISHNTLDTFNVPEQTGVDAHLFDTSMATNASPMIYEKMLPASSLAEVEPVLAQNNNNMYLFLQNERTPARNHQMTEQRNKMTATSSPAEGVQSTSCKHNNQNDITAFETELDLTKSSEGSHDVIENEGSHHQEKDLNNIEMVEEATQEQTSIL